MQTFNYLSLKNLKQLTSLNFFVFVLIITFLIFNFLDILIFEYSKTLPNFIFWFFRNIIDPLSDILDPLHIIIISLVIIFCNYNLKKIFKNPAKSNLMEKKSGLKIKKISNSFNYYSLVSKHFFWSLSNCRYSLQLNKIYYRCSTAKIFFFEGFERFDFFNILHKANSFPSGHTQAFTLAILIMIYFKKYHFYILSLATLMGLSRIFMTMHFPSDIFFGAYLGSIVPILLYQKNFEKKIKLFKQSGVTNLYSFLKINLLENIYMTVVLKMILFTFLVLGSSEGIAGNWCKAIYTKDISEGDFQAQISKCKNSDNFFLAIHTSYNNSGHLLNSLISELCDLRKNIVRSEPRQNDPYFTVVCEFRRHYLRKN